MAVHKPIDMTKEGWEEELFPLLEGLFKNTSIYYTETAELQRLRSRFAELSGITVDTTGTNAFTCEDRQLWLLMKDRFGWTRILDCVAYGWNTRYERDGIKGETLFMPFGDQGMLIANYRTAISALEQAQQP